MHEHVCHFEQLAMIAPFLIKGLLMVSVKLLINIVGLDLLDMVVLDI